MWSNQQVPSEVARSWASSSNVMKPKETWLFIYVLITPWFPCERSCDIHRLGLAPSLLFPDQQKSTNFHQHQQHLLYTAPTLEVRRDGGECLPIPSQNPSRNHFKMGKVSRRSSTKLFKVPHIEAARMKPPQRGHKQEGLWTNAGWNKRGWVRLRQIGGQINYIYIYIIITLYIYAFTHTRISMLYRKKKYIYIIINTYTCHIHMTV